MSRTIVLPLTAAAIALGAGIGVHKAHGQSTDQRIIPKDASEEFFVQKINSLN